MTKASNEQYRIFTTAAECGSISKAAEKLYITQPAVSQAIKQLEKSLDCRLFHRTGRGVTLTEGGKILYDHVASALGLIKSGEEKVTKWRNLQSGMLRIGAGDTITSRFLLPYVENFHKAHPDISIKVKNRTSPALVEALKQGQIDIAFVNLPLDKPELNIIQCKAIQDIFVVGEKYAPLAESPLPLADLQQYPLIMLEQAANSRRYVDTFLQKEGIALTPEIELGAYDLLMDFAKIGIGIALAVDAFSRKELEQGSLKPLQTLPPIPPRHIGVCWLSALSPSPSAETFINYVLAK